MRDFLPTDVRRRRYVISVIEDVYQRYGFEPLETPALENIDTLTGKYGEEGAKLIFKVLRRGEHEASGETDLALRYDLTVPLARVVAEHRGKLPKFFKRYQIQPVWRADRPARGRFREFYQCDVDAIGSQSMVVEAELCGAVAEILERLGFDDFILRLNHRKILSGILELAGISKDRVSVALIELDKLDKIGREGVQKGLTDRGFALKSSEALVQLVLQQPSVAVDSSGFGERLDQKLLEHSDAAEGFRELEQILQFCATNPAGKHIQLDRSLARGLAYYTGAIMEVSVPDLAGSLGGGGRYDGLIGMFSEEDIPACGFSLGLERILVVMAERKMFPNNVDTAAPDVLVTIFDRDSIPETLRLASELRQAGYRVDVYPQPDRLGKQFNYAAALNATIVVVLGPDERVSGMVRIKDMKTGEQLQIPRLGLGAPLRHLIPRPSEPSE